MATVAAPSSLANPFPGRVLRAGCGDRISTLAIQKRLNAVGCGPIVENGSYGAETVEAVELFQSRSADMLGNPLRVDGQVGPMTWGALFGVNNVPSVTAPGSQLAGLALQVAVAEIGTMEVPLGSNRGPRVDQYLTCVGLDPESGHYAWCAAFVYWCYQQASQQLSEPNPVIKTAAVLDHWNRALARNVQHVACQEACDMPSLVKPGMIFILSTGAGNGHTGIVEKVEGVVLTTVEGNTNEGGSREGIGVFRRKGRRLVDINRGFLLYS